MLQGGKINKSVSLISWNVLANCYIFPDGYRYVDRKLLGWSHRRDKVRQILESRDADIVCLQEVDRPNDVAQDLSSMGYKDIVFEQRCCGRQDGLLIAYKSCFNILLRTVVYFDDLCETLVGTLVGEERTRKHNIAQIVVLQHEATKEVFVLGNTHLYWNPNSEDVKLFQARKFVYSLETVYEICVGRHQEPIVIACGDFNSRPNTAMFDLITKSIMPSRKTYTKFMCDNNLRQLCRWLRALGIDVHYMDINPYLDSNKEEFQAQDLFKKLNDEERVLLTTSHQIVRRRGCPPCMLISPRRDKAEKNFQRIVETFNVQIKEEDFYKRCVICNNMIVPLDRSQLKVEKDNRIVHIPSSSNTDAIKENVKSTMKVPLDGRTDRKQDQIFKFQSEHYIQNIVANVWESNEPLYQCSGCEQIYWWGKEPGQSAVRAEKLVSRLVDLADEVYTVKEEKRRERRRTPNNFVSSQAKRLSPYTKKNTLHNSALDEQFSRLKLRISLCKSPSFNNSLLKRTSLTGAFAGYQVNIPCMPNDILFWPNERFKFRTVFSEFASTNTTDEFDGCIDYIFFYHSQSKVRIKYQPVIQEGLNDGPLPNADWPSDHRLLHCEFVL